VSAGRRACGLRATGLRVCGLRATGLLTLCLLAVPAQAHSFGKLYTLPVPFWLYGWASAAALLLSFLVLAWFFSQPDVRQRGPVAAPVSRNLPRGLLAVLQGLALLALLLCIATGFFGSHDAYRNINMTLFWIIFVLGLSYVTVLFGNVFALANPWQTLAHRMARGRYAYPSWLGCWPALLLYAAFVWSELFAGFSPRSLAWMLLGYTVLNLLACWLFGTQAWFRHGELFSVYFRLLGRMAPLAYRPASASVTAGWHWRRPGAGLLSAQPGSFGEVLFILFMLSSTAFDGLHATETWALMFWRDGFALLSPWLGNNIVIAYSTLQPLYMLYQTLALLLSPLLYLAFFAACLWLMKCLTATPVSLRELIFRFSYSLLPIVAVYHFTHYFTLVLGQGAQLPGLLSDPLGLGWHLLSLQPASTSGLLLDMAWVWHIQVAAILFGHIASVCVAHAVARALFKSSTAVWLSQLPLLVLMMTFTVFGLWILAQPLSTEVLR